MTKEERKEYNKKYRLANKEKYAAHARAYYHANKHKSKSSILYQRYYMNSKRDGFYTVYYLPKENYVGVTTNLYSRLSSHRNEYKRNVEGVEIFGKYKNKREALDTECELHSLGYAGANPTHLKHQQLNN
mgnify:CR=1 FL=1